MDEKPTFEELLATLTLFVDGRPTKEPPKLTAIAHVNWEVWQKARELIALLESATARRRP